MREATRRPGENTIDPIGHTHADPADGPPPRSWLDRGAARLVALGIAVALALVLVLSLGDEVVALVGGQENAASETAIVVEDPAKAACIAQRTADVDALLADNVITPGQHEDFRRRASLMCETGAQVAPRP